MRKIIAIALLLLASCMAAFAYEGTYWTAGVFQSLSATSVTGSFSYDNLEAEAGIGLPFLSTLGVFGRNIYSASDGMTRIQSALRHPVVSLTATYAVMDWETDSLEAFMRLGLMTDAAFGSDNGIGIVGSYGFAAEVDMMIGLFRFCFQGCIPASSLLAMMHQDSSKGFYRIGAAAKDGSMYSELSSLACLTGSARISVKYIFGG